MIVVLAALGLSSCVEPTDQASKASDEAATRDKLVQEIDSLEKDLTAHLNFDVQMNRVRANEVLNKYRSYIMQHPRDSITAEYLFRAADLSVGLGNYDAAINYLNRLIKDFPNFDRIVEMWLFKGFIYEAYMNNHGEAARTYKEIIARYPNHRLASDARAALENLTLTEEQLLEKLSGKSQH